MNKWHWKWLCARCWQAWMGWGRHCGACVWCKKG